MIRRFASWWWSVFRKQSTIGKLIFASVSLCVVCFLCSLPSVILSPSPTPTPQLVAESNPTSEPTQVSATDTPVSTDTPTTMPEPTPTAEPTNTPAATNTPAPTDTPAPTNTPKPVDTPQKSELFCLGQAETSEEMELEQQLSDILGTVERIDGRRVCAYKTDKDELIVDYASFDVAPIGALPILNMEFVDIMKIVHESNIPYGELFITATLPFESENGIEERMVLSIIYSKGYVDSVNYDAYPDVLEAGETLIWHPSLG
jgi:hypothetical protein